MNLLPRLDQLLSPQTSLVITLILVFIFHPFTTMILPPNVVDYTSRPHHSQIMLSELVERHLYQYTLEVAIQVSQSSCLLEKNPHIRDWYARSLVINISADSQVPALGLDTDDHG